MGAGVAVGWLDASVDRVRDIIEGTHPSVAVSGRSINAGRFKAARLHGGLDDPQFPGAHYHRGYELLVERSGRVVGDPPNAHAGSKRRRAVLVLRVGYLFGRDAPATGAGVGTSLWTPTITGHNDADDIEDALTYPAFWGGSSIVGMVPTSDAETLVVIPQQRALVVSRWEMTCSFAPGAS